MSFPSPRRFHLLAATSILLLTAACQGTGSTDSELPTVEQIVAAAHQAMGGEAAVAEVRSVRAFARCTGPDGPYTTEIQTDREGDLLFFQTREREGKTEHFRAFVRGPYTWAELVDAEAGGVEPQPVAVRAMARSHDFFAFALDFPFFLNEPKVFGRTEVGGEPYLELRLTDNFKRPVRAYFHAKTHLFAGLEMFNPIFPKELVQLRIVDWKQVGSVLLPSRAIVTDGSGDFELDFQEITVNDVDPALFEVPDEIVQAAEERREAREQGEPAAP